MDMIDEDPDALGRGAGRNAMAEIEDMAVALRGALENVVGAGEKMRRRPEQRRRIEVALQRMSRAEAFPCLV
jgi:hypothetical protein